MEDRQIPTKRKWLKRPSPAMVVAVLALICALGGTAYATSQLPKNSVGSRQLKKRSVTTGKIANNAVNSAKVANGSLTGSDINLNALGTVPDSKHADIADEAGTLAGHFANCPEGTTLVHGVCFDSTPNPVVANLKEAANNCAAKGGFLPSPMDLFSVHATINLGTGIGTDHQYTNEIYANTAGVNYSTVVVDGTGAVTEQSVASPSRYICEYALVR